MSEILWLRGLLVELGLNVANPAVLGVHNQSTKSVMENGIRSDHTKHVDVKYHFTTQEIEKGTVKLVWVQTEENQADILTKALGGPQFVKFRKQVMSD